MAEHFLSPDWPAPAEVKSAITLRSGGCSRTPFDTNNLAMHVEDSEVDVQSNRNRLIETLALPAQPLWLDQCHGTALVYVPEYLPAPQQTPTADGSYTDKVNTVCAILTADCLPVLFCNQSGTQVAAAHAGWRGLCGGILRNTVATFKHSPREVMAYLGPAIGPQVFEVGAEVLQAFLQNAQNEYQQQAVRAAFKPVAGSADKYLANLYDLARAELSASGVTEIYGGNYCSYTDSDHFYSFRRESKTGRNASLIWL
ncbi:MAG: peptidoglycan editing factor PgeF [Porticoccaceae bacterium]|nr:peptidoglycan editing factor PgeF [Porticoccaceae bacterium]